MAMPRKRPLEDPNQYYAYVWRLDGEVLWVGQGKNNRCRANCKASWGGRPAALLLILEDRRHEIEVEVIPCLSKEESIVVEKKLLVELKPKYNTAPQKGGWKGMHTPKGLRSISQKNSGKKMSAEFKEKCRQRMLGNSILKGFKHTEDSKRKISEASRGKSISQLCKDAASKRMSTLNKTNPPRKGIKCSESHKAKLSESAKRRHARSKKISITEGEK